MKGAWKTIAAVVPGPALLWVGKWLGLFSDTILAYPGWQQEADKLARVIGTFTAVVICLIFSRTSQPVLRTRAKWGFAFTFLLLILCLLIYSYLGRAMEAQEAQQWQDIWMMIYIAAMVTLVATISLGALSVREEANKTIWIVIGIALFLVGILVVVVVARRFFQ